jgi:hypothetical protein
MDTKPDRGRLGFVTANQRAAGLADSPRSAAELPPGPPAHRGSRMSRQSAAESGASMELSWTGSAVAIQVASTAIGASLDANEARRKLRKKRRERPRCACYVFVKSDPHFHMSTVEKANHDNPARHLQLRAASPYDPRRTSAHLHVSLSGMPAPHRRRAQQSGAIPARAGHLRRYRYNLDSDRRKREHAGFSLLPDMRLHRLLGERRLSGSRGCCHRKLCRAEFPRADYCGVGGVTPPLGLIALRHCYQASGETGVVTSPPDCRFGAAQQRPN